MSPSRIHLCCCGKEMKKNLSLNPCCITTEQAERENLCDLLLVLQVLLVLSNICSFASGIKLLLVSGAWIFGAVGPAGVYFRLLYLFSM
ncbi:hypothetical protein PVAP13_2NG000300 [Panicum virgatum]|uniref:Uncharacterized protein n=1 Tax=Panicum virgatum TaxID=38727 RepID=A0A8T0V3J4_PANVG|nr:hypothetical protein PVAP13_2NG000300 [Panicum virgatum]